MKDLDRAIAIDPELNVAYFNRGIVKIELKRMDSGCLDLSKAGELGMEKAYDKIKEHCY